MSEGENVKSPPAPTWTCKDVEPRGASSPVTVILTMICPGFDDEVDAELAGAEEEVEGVLGPGP